MDFSALRDIPYFLTQWYDRVRDDPEKTVLVDGGTGEEMTAGQLEDLSGRVYAWLRKNGVGTEDFVMLCMPRGIHMVVCMLGVWKAGAAFTAVEEDYAADRIAYIRRDVNCRVFLDRALYQTIAEGAYEEGFVTAGDHDAAFAVYTSGTTGFPKGVLHEYGNIRLNRASSNVSSGSRVNARSRYSLISPFNFVASVKIVLALLRHGCTLYVLPYETVKNPGKLRQYFLDNRISIAFLSPSILRILGSDLGPYLKYVITGSEPANNLFLPGIVLVNTYSMSEGAFTVAQFIIDRPYDICPVGKPNHDGIRLRILDENGHELPDGETGEIAFENPFMRGYINLPEETQKALRGGLYHTGDLGKKLPDGNLVLVGRANDMIKINGNRIEPAEIEKAFRETENVSWCCAKGFEEENRSYICLYYTDDIRVDEQELKEKLGKILPYYMIPSYYVRIDRVPLLPNGKIDKKSLRPPARDTYAAAYTPPSDEMEKRLCDAAAKVLHLERVGALDDFYRIGGDSITTMELVEEMDLAGLTAADVYRGSTIRRIAAICRGKAQADREADGRTAEGTGTGRVYPLTGTQRRIFQSQMTAPDRAMWGLSLTYRLDDVTNAQKICDALNRVIREYAIFRTVIEYDENGVPVQRLDDAVITPARLADVGSAEFEEICKTFAGIRTMTGCPLYKAAVYRVDHREAYLFMEFHHLIIDGSAFALLLGAICAAYRDQPLPPDTFCAYLGREAKKKEDADYPEDERYFAGTYGTVNWDAGCRPDRQAGEPGIGRKIIPLQGITTDALEAFVKRTGYSVNALFLLAALLAQRECDHADEILLNWVFHNRTDPVAAKALGIVFRYLPVGLGISDGSSAGELLSEIKTRSNDAIRHARCDWIAEHETVPENDSVMFVYETQSITSSGVAEQMGLKQFWIPYNQEAAIFRFVVQVYDLPQEKYLLLYYRTECYSDAFADRYAAVMTRVLGRLLEAESPEERTAADLTAE